MLISDQTVDMARRVSKKRPTNKKRATKGKRVIKRKRTTSQKQAGRGLPLFALPWAFKIQKEVPIIADKAFAAFKEAYNKKKT